MTNIQQRIFEGERLGVVLTLIRAELESAPFASRTPFTTEALLDRLSDIEQDYDRVVSFLGNGFDDPSRDSLCGKLLNRCLSLSGDTELCRMAEKNASVMRGFAALRQTPPVADIIISHIETDVLNTTRHAAFMDTLFNSIIGALQWTDGKAQEFGDMLLNPLMEEADAQLLVSALTLSLLNVFDSSKWLLLIRLWRESESIAIKQRALVGWVLTTPPLAYYRNQVCNPFASLQKEIDTILDDDESRHELLELQTLLFHSISAESDGKRVQEEIMPTLTRHSGVTIKDGKFVETNEDPMDDILPGQSDDMEDMEESIKKLEDMQRSGADIYFSGFRLMKRFPFFSSLRNWFAPFSADNPALNVNNEKVRQFLQLINTQSQFCESDKYSIALAFKQVMPEMPEGMVSLLNNAPAFDSKKTNSAAERRRYLQDLYRFFTLSQMNSDFPTPFSPSPLVFNAHLFPLPQLTVECEQLAVFLYKRHYYSEVITLFENLDSYATTVLQQLAAGAMRKLGRNSEALALCNKLLMSDSGNIYLLSCKAAATAALGKYDEAAQCYALLIPQLERLYFENPSDHRTSNRLLTAYLLNGHIDDAIRVTRSLPHSAFLHGVYALLLGGKTAEAVELMKTGVSECYRDPDTQTIDYRALSEAMAADAPLQQELGVSKQTLDLLVSVCTKNIV